MCQDFMNSATMKYNKIITKEGTFKGSVHTIQDDIVALFTEKLKPGFKRNSKRKANDDDNKTMDNKRPKLKTEEPS